MIDEETRQIEQARHPGNQADDVQNLRPGIGGGEKVEHGGQRFALGQPENPTGQSRVPNCEHTGLSLTSIRRTSSARPVANCGCASTVGTRTYGGAPALAATPAYSMPSPTSLDRPSAG